MKTSFSLCGQEIRPNLFLSPMHGVSDGSFRRSLQRLCAGRIPLFVSEFVSVDQIKMRVPREMEMMEHSPEENVFGIQIFGSDIDDLVNGALVAQNEYGAQFVELNCGCPAPNVVRRGGGSGLLKELPHLQNILHALRKNVTVPLTMKVRLGWDSEQIVVNQTVKMAQEEGLDLFVIHGRTRVQGYKGFADWNHIAEAKSKSTIPIVGNGDILSIEDALMRLKTAELDGVSIGRGAMHNPWIFKQMADFVDGKPIQIPEFKDQVEFFEIFIDELTKTGFSGTRLMGRLKQLSARILKCFNHPEMADLRALVLRSTTPEEFWSLLYNFNESCIKSGILMTFDPSPVENLNGKGTNIVEEGQDYKR